MASKATNGKRKSRRTLTTKEAAKRCNVAESTVHSWGVYCRCLGRPLRRDPDSATAAWIERDVAEIERRQKERASLEAAGYLPLARLARKRRLSRDTVSLWSRKCPWLPGAQVVRAVPDPWDSAERLYSERDVVAAIAARDAATIPPVDEYVGEYGEKHVWIRKAKCYAGVSWQVVFRWVHKGAYWRNGEKLDHCEKLIYNGRGRPFPRLFVPLRQLREFAREYRKASKRKASGGRLAGGEVCRLLGCSFSFLGTLITKGHPALGRKLRFWGAPPYREYSAEDVSVMEPAFNRPKAPFSDKWGRWLPVAFAAKKHNRTEQTMRQMHKHGDAMTGLPVRGNRVLCRAGACCRETLFLHEGDLEAIFKARSQPATPDKPAADAADDAGPPGAGNGRAASRPAATEPPAQQPAGAAAGVEPDGPAHGRASRIGALARPEARASGPATAAADPPKPAKRRGRPPKWDAMRETIRAEFREASQTGDPLPSLLGTLNSYRKQNGRAIGEGTLPRGTIADVKRQRKAVRKSL